MIAPDDQLVQRMCQAPAEYEKEYSRKVRMEEKGTHDKVWTQLDKKMILVFAMLFVFGYSPAAYAEEEPKQAPGQELMGEGQEEMSFEDMIGTMEKSEAEKR